MIAALFYDDDMERIIIIVMIRNAIERRNPDAIIAEHVNKSGLMGAVQKLHSICDE